jgi:hypothetical protein
MGAATAAQACSGAYRSGEWWRCRCPVCGSQRASLALKDGRYGLIVKCWRGCDPDDVRAELRASGLDETAPIYREECDPNAEEQRRQTDVLDRIRWATEIWLAGLLVVAGTIVDFYLRSRGIILSTFPPTLRYLPASHWYARHPNSSIPYPVMLAAVGDHEGSFVGIHRTWITAEGKALVEPNRMSLGPVSGGAIRLGMLDPDPRQTLIIGEGIESSLAASLLLNNPNCWAAISANGIENLILPDEIRSVQIMVDRDANGAGEAAARSAALRWLAEGRRVQLILPDRIGADANDLLRETQA